MTQQATPTRKKTLNKRNITALLIEIQDCGNLRANSLATRAVDAFHLQREHLRQTRKQ